MKKALIALIALMGLVYLFWGGGDDGGPGRFDAPAVTGDQAEPVADFNRALFLDKASNFMPRGMILKAARGLSDHEVRITVAERWKTLDQKVRLKLARDMWKTWLKLFPAEAEFRARIIIADQKGRKQGGSRLLNASDIWVREN